MNKLRNFFRVLFTPGCWIQNDHEFSQAWDVELNYLLDTYTFANFDRFTAMLGRQEVWVANHPYASFRPIPSGSDLPLYIRPSRSTILRAGDLLNKARFSSR